MPNATIMVILDADRFGMAQLHQLRGRVGRGPGLKSWCYLVGAGASEGGEERLSAMVRTQNGFELAEIDLDIRGEGTIMGERQKGKNDLKLASLRRDREWVSKAREIAFELVDADPTLAGHPDLLDEIEAFLDPDERTSSSKADVARANPHAVHAGLPGQSHSTTSSSVSSRYQTSRQSLHR